MSALNYADWIMVGLGALAVCLCCKIFSVCKCSRDMNAGVRVHPFYGPHHHGVGVRPGGVRGVPGPPPVPAWGAVSAMFPPVKYQLPTGENAEAAVCIVCIDTLKAGDDVLVFPCAHTFHIDCIRLWFSKQAAALCPLCKRNVLQTLVLEEVTV